METNQPLSVDDFTGIGGIGDDFSLLTSRDPLIWPEIDSHGSGWTIHPNLTSSVVGFGIAFRVVDQSNYLRVGFIGNSLTLQQVSGGIPTFIGSAVLGAQDFYVTCSGPTIQVFRVSGNTLLFTSTTPFNQSATKHGIWKSVSGSIKLATMELDRADLLQAKITLQTLTGKFLIFSATASLKKYYFSVYSDPPGLITDLTNDDFNTINGNLCSGATGLWMMDGVGGTPYFLGGQNPRFLIRVFSPGTKVVGTAVIPSYPKTYVASGSTISATTRNHIKVNMTPTEIDVDSTFSTRQLLGFDAAPTLGSHSYPYAGGYLTKSIEITTLPPLGVGLPSSLKGKVTHALIVGKTDLTSDTTAAPKISSTLELMTWETYQAHVSIDTTENEFYNFQSYSTRLENSAPNIGVPVCTFFEGLPDGSIWIGQWGPGSHAEELSTPNLVDGISNRSFKGINKVFIGGGSSFADITSSFPGVMGNIIPAKGAGGSVIGFCSPTSGTPAKFQIMNSQGQVIFSQTAGVNSSSRVLCASNNFFYVFNVVFTSTANNPTSAPSSLWAVSLDGSIRFPCYAVPKLAGGGSGSYTDRVSAESNGIGLGNHVASGTIDCVKSQLAFAPLLENPDFSV